MRKVIFGLAVLAGVITISDSAQARDRWNSSRSQRVSRSYYQQPVEYAQPQQEYGYEQNNGQSMFGGLMDMERRKNAWLRRTFFGQ